MKKPQVSIVNNHRGTLTQLTFNDDPIQMNWVVSPDYLKQVGYDDQDKLFGEFTLTVANHQYQSMAVTPVISEDDYGYTMTYHLDQLQLRENYRLVGNHLLWTITLTNQAG